MKTLVLNTLGKDYTEQITALIKDKEVEIVDTSDMKIVHCMGCNQCWLKTPGICAYKDDYEIILKKLVQADNLWIVSDTRFGFLDYKGKRLMDRIMPMLNMTIGFRDGWMRHELRYHPLNIGLLYKGDADQMMMEDWCKRTAANIGGQSFGAIALQVKSEKCKVKSSSSTAVHVWRSSAIQTRLFIRLSKVWKKQASLGNFAISPAARNGKQHVKPSFHTSVSSLLFRSMWSACPV